MECMKHSEMNMKSNPFSNDPINNELEKNKEPIDPIDEQSDIADINNEDPVFFEPEDLVQLGESAIAAVGMVSGAISSGFGVVKKKWKDNKVGKQVQSIGWGSLACTVGRGWGTLSDAADFWLDNGVGVEEDLFLQTSGESGIPSTSTAEKYDVGESGRIRVCQNRGVDISDEKSPRVIGKILRNLKDPVVEHGSSIGTDACLQRIGISQLTKVVCRSLEQETAEHRSLGMMWSAEIPPTMMDDSDLAAACPPIPPASPAEIEDKPLVLTNPTTFLGPSQRVHFSNHGTSDLNLKAEGILITSGSWHDLGVDDIKNDDGEWECIERIPSPMPLP